MNIANEDGASQDRGGFQMNVTRYNNLPIGMKVENGGRWVYFDDYAALESNRDEWRRDFANANVREREALDGQQRMEEMMRELEKERDELRAKLEKSKSEACELRDLLSNAGIKV